MKTMKRFLSCMLIVSMIMSFMSVSAFAEEPLVSRFDCDCETRHTHEATCYEMQPICGYNENEPICGLELHRHEDTCYTLHEGHVDSCYKFICTINAEDDQYDCNTAEHICGTEGVSCETPLRCTATAHVHTDGTCHYPVVCTLAEGEEHSHEGSCYDTTAACTLVEHTHTEDCYETCILQHVHGENCYHSHTGFNGRCYELNCGLEIGNNLTCTATEHPEHLDACYHKHVDGCYKSVLSCGESVFHIHSSECYGLASGKRWKYGAKLKCEYAEMDIHGHKYSCMTDAEKEKILTTYPAQSSDFTVTAYEEPYVFSRVRTYLPSGMCYYFPNAGDWGQPQLYIMADWSELNEGDKWNIENGKRFVLGESNFNVVYCCDAEYETKQYHMHRQINLEDAGYYDDVTAQKIRSVMMNGYPYRSLEELQADLCAANVPDADNIDEGNIIAGVQLAIWAYSNSALTADYEYFFTESSSSYPLLTADWEKTSSRKDLYIPESDVRARAVADYLIGLAEANPVPAPQSQIVVSQVEVANLIMTPDENGTYTVDLQVILNGEYDNSHEDTNIIITAVAGSASASITADGSSVYNLRLEGYSQGENVTVTMSGTQYLPAGVYFYEPYTTPGQDIRKVSQNMVGINEGKIPVGDQVVLDGTALTSASLELKKVNEDGKALAGAEFELAYVGEENITTTLGTYTSDVNGDIQIEGLMAGKTYQLTESKAPFGYDAITGVITLNIGADGNNIFFNLPNGVTCDSAEDETYVLTVVNCETPPPPYIPPYNPPVTPEEPPVTPEEPPVEPEEPPLVEIEEPDVPLVDVEDPEVPLVDMEDPEVPLTDVPKTSDNANLMIWMMLVLLSAAGLTAIRIAERKER